MTVRRDRKTEKATAVDQRQSTIDELLSESGFVLLHGHGKSLQGKAQHLMRWGWKEIRKYDPWTGTNGGDHWR